MRRIFAGSLVRRSWFGRVAALCLGFALVGGAQGQPIDLLGVPAAEMDPPKPAAAAGGAAGPAGEAAPGKKPSAAPKPEQDADRKYLEKKRQEFIDVGLVDDAKMSLDDFTTLYYESMTMRLKSLQEEQNRHWLPMIKLNGTRPDESDLFKRAARWNALTERSLKEKLDHLVAGRYAAAGEWMDKGLFKIDPDRPETLNPFRELDRYVAEFAKEKPSWGQIASAVATGALLRVGSTVEAAFKDPLSAAGAVALTIAVPHVMLTLVVLKNVGEVGGALINIHEGARENRWDKALGGWEKLGGCAAELGGAKAAARVFKALKGRGAKPPAPKGDLPANTPVGRRGMPAGNSKGTDGSGSRGFNANGNSGRTIGGREYGPHAIDRMQESGLIPSVIENAINHGARSPGNVPGRTVCTDAINKITVIIDTLSGRVITVIPRGA